MTKLNELSYWELKGLEGALGYLIDDNPELADITVTELHEKILDEMETKRND